MYDYKAKKITMKVLKKSIPLLFLLIVSSVNPSNAQEYVQDFLANFGITFDVGALEMALIYHIITLPIRDFILTIEFVADRIWLPLFRLILLKFDRFFPFNLLEHPPELISNFELAVRLIANFANVFYDLMVDMADACDYYLDLIQSKAPISILNEITNNQY